MATGVPKTRPVSVQNTDMGEVQITYRGKKSATEILSHKTADLHLLSTADTTPQNRLYFGENAGVLASLARDPAICGHVRLVYIDPPFATRTAFHSRKLDHAYEDTLTGSEYVEFIRERLILLHRLLADGGSLYLHLDDKMVFQMKLVLDEIFGPDGYRNCITRRKCNPKNYTRKQYGNVADYVLFYTKGKQYVWNRPVEAWTEARAKEYQYVEPATGRLFMKVPVHAPGVRNGETGKPWRGKVPPPGKHWQFAPKTLDEMDARGEIYWSANGNPRRKVYFDESLGVGVQDIWTEFRDAHNQNVCITGYPTEKNPGLIKRIIEASSHPGDLVLDCFAGSGTTLAVAGQLGRRWIGVDNSIESLRTILGRFANGTKPMGAFVSRTTDKKVIDLFDVSGGAARRQPQVHHEPVTDFMFWAEHDLRSAALSVIRDWESQLTDPAVSFG